MPGLYDAYRLSNSTVVPQFTGTTAPEALQVGQYLQQLYDTAKTGAADIGAATDNLQSLEQDIPLQNEVRNKIQGDIAKMSASRDWENNVDAVRGLGRYYAQRSMELAAPMKQFQEYQASLENKDLGLRPEQKQILLARSKAGYAGLSKDPLGRFVGKFTGVSPAKNVDMTKWADSVMAGMKEFKNGQIIEYSDDKGYLVKKGSSKEWVSKERVQQALDAAFRIDGDVQSYMNMEGDNAGFNASRVPIGLIPDRSSTGQPNGMKQQALQMAAQSGRSPEEMYGRLAKQATMNNLMDQTHRYLQTKYAYDRRESEQGLSSDATWNQNNKSKNDLGMFGDAVTDTGIDLTQRFGSAKDIETASTNAAASMEQASTAVMAQKQTIAKALGTPVDKLTDAQISGYFAKTDPTGYGKYKSNVQAVEAGKNTVAELNQVRSEAMDLAVKKKFPGQKFDTLKQSATDDMVKAITSNKASVIAFDQHDKKITINPSNVKDFEVIDGDTGTGSSSYITIRNTKTGETGKVYPKRSDMGGHSSLAPIAQKFDGINWESEWKQAATNIRSNSMWMPLNNKTTPDGETTKSGAYAMRVNGILRAGSGGLSIKDANLTDMSSGDQRDVKARISSGKFDVLGVGKVGSDGKLYVKVSVLKDENADDPADKFQTVVVGVDSNMANKLSQYAVEAGVRDNDQRSLQFGLAMAPGSGYEQVLNMGTTGRLQVSRQTAGKKTPLYEVVPNITGQESDAIQYVIYKLNDKGERMDMAEQQPNDAFELGAFLDLERTKNQAVIEKKNK